MKPLICLCFLSLALQAQQSTKQANSSSQSNPKDTPPPTKPEDLCILQGQVTNIVTGAPLPKAEINLSGTERVTAGAMPGRYSGTADAGGNFTIKDIEPGKYRLSAERTGFVSLQYGARGPSRGGATLTLSAGEHMKDLPLRLTPQAVITGRIVDDNNEPVASVMVRTMRFSYMMGRRQLMPAGYATTNDLGEYRIYGLAAGRYYLSAKDTDNNWEATVDASATPVLEGYVGTYYPGTKDPTTAVPIEVAAGVQLRGVNLTLLKARTFRVRGRITGRPEAEISIAPRGQPQWSSLDGQGRSTGPKGSFELNGIMAGAYTLTASSWADNKVWSARQEIDLGESNIEDIVLTLSPGFDVSGELTVEGTNPPNMDSATVMLMPREMRSIYGTLGDRLHDGKFTMSSLPPALYDLRVMGLPDGYWTKSVHMGDQEVRDQGIDLTSGPSGPIMVTVAPNAGQIDGAVMNDQQRPAAGATVVLVPDIKLRERGDAYQNTTSDQAGRFSFKNLAPATYKLFAWEDVEYGAYMDPDFLRPFEDRGQTISIDEGSHETVQVNVIPGDAAPSGRKDK